MEAVVGIGMVDRETVLRRLELVVAAIGIGMVERETVLRPLEREEVMNTIMIMMIITITTITPAPL